MPATTVREAIAYVEARGWMMIRWGKGDHRIYGHSESGARITIPGTLNHALPLGTWKAIKRQADSVLKGRQP
jgi:predicted RNA binding protein YcfA (HicA-like mRNA interferase family)